MPSLKDFLQRGKVMAHYRDFLRAASGLEEPQRSETRRHIRHEFRKHRDETDPGQVRTLLVVGQRQLDQLRDLVAVVATTSSAEAPQGADVGTSSGAGATGGAKAPGGWPWASQERLPALGGAKIPKTSTER